MHTDAKEKTLDHTRLVIHLPSAICALPDLSLRFATWRYRRPLERADQ